MKLGKCSHLTLHHGLKIALFLILVYFPLFLHLDALAIRLWDEARLAENAYEMYKNGNYLVTYFSGEPDMWSTKPPFMIWAQVFCFKVLGISTLSVRLPAALAAFFTCSLCLYFSVKFLKNYWLGLITVLLLVTCTSYVNEHVARTGDYDSVLCFFTTAYIFAFFLYVELEEQKYSLFFFTALSFAVLTKSIQALIFLPALGAYLLTQKKFYLLKNAYLYKYAAIFVAVILGYYLLREHYNQGYLKAVWENELGGRYMTTLEHNEGDFWFYFRLITNEGFANWYYLIPCGLALGLTSKMEKLPRFTLYVSLLILFYGLVISFSKTKLVWYQTPLLPLISFLVAIAMYYIFDFLKEKLDTRNLLTINIIPYLFLFVTFVSAYEKIITKVYFPNKKELYKEANNISYLLEDALHSKQNIKQNIICSQGYQAQIMFYINLLNEKQQNVGFKSWDNLQTNDLVITFQPDIQANIEHKYQNEVVFASENIKKYKINGAK